jgi:catechol 2,3-dioxygenase-like lactoylglutathione lyase family enzyme
LTQVTAVLVVAPITTCPPNHTSLTPFICVDGASAAIDFYVSVFGAKPVDRMDGPGGTVTHAELDFGTGRLQLSDPQDAYKIAAPDSTALATHSIGVLETARRLGVTLIAYSPFASGMLTGKFHDDHSLVDSMPRNCAR